MKIFLGAETEGPAASKWFALQKEFTPLLSFLNTKFYGESLTNIGIISIILRDQYFENGGYKERKYYSKKKHVADIRLKIDYYKFIRSDKEVARAMYIEHILESITVAGRKAGHEFKLDQLLSDVRDVLK